MVFKPVVSLKERSMTEFQEETWEYLKRIK